MSTTTSSDMAGNVPSSNPDLQQQTDAAGLAEFMGSHTQPITASSEEASPPRLDSHTIDSVLLREQLIHSATYTGAEIINVNLLGALDPFAAVLSTTVVQNAVKPYAYFRGDIRVTVRTTPPGSCFGAMIFSAICEGGLDTTPSATVNGVIIDDLAVDNLFSAPNDVHRIINFENASAVTIDLPFVYHAHYIPLDGVAKWMWRLQMQSLVPLQSTISTTAAASVRIYASILPGYELAIPKYQMKSVTKHRDAFNEKVKKATGGSKVSDIAGAVSSVASKVAGSVPMLAPFATPIAAGASVVSSIASFLGFTRESTYMHPEIFQHRFHTNLAITDGVDTSDTLAVCSGAALSIDPSIGGATHEDEMSFEALRQRWGIIGYFDLTTSTVAGKVIYNLPVTPSYAGVFLGRAVFTPGGYYGLPFQFWRGGMEYIIYIPSSSNMRGMLQVAYNPNVRTTAPPFTVNDPTGQVHTIALDLSSTQQHMIKVPYASPEICKRNERMCDGKYSNRADYYCNGSLDFYLATPWVAPRSGLVSTRVFIFARPAQDMVYSGAYGFGKLAYQSEAADESVAYVESSILTQPLDISFNAAQVSLSETMPSTRALCQKFSYIWPSDSATFIMTQYPPPMTITTPATFGWVYDGSIYPNIAADFCWTTFYSVLFTGVRGGTRLKFVRAVGETSEIPLGAISAFNATQTTAQILSTTLRHTAIQSSSIDKCVEFAYLYCGIRTYHNPRLFNYVFMPGVTPPSGMSFANDSRIVGFQPNSVVPAASPVRGNVWYAGSSDYSATRFRRVPSLVASTILPPT